MDELVEAMAREVKPELFSDDETARHRAASPYRVTFAQEATRELIRRILGSIEAKGYVLTRKAKPEELENIIQPDGGLFDGGHYIAWTPEEKEICLDCRFTVEELEAFAQHMRAHAAPKVTPT